MNTHNTRGWIIRSVKTQENSAESLVFTKDFGKIWIKVPGGAKSSSKLMSACDIFREIEFSLAIAEGAYKGRLISARELSSFELLSGDFQRYVEVSRVCELIDALTAYIMPSENKYKLLGECIKWIGFEDHYIFAKAYFFIQYLKISGHGLQLGVCSDCRKIVEDGGYFLACEGLVCRRCKSVEKYSIKMDNISLVMLKDFSVNSSAAIIANCRFYSRERMEYILDFLMPQYIARKLKSGVYKKAGTY